MKANPVAWFEIPAADIKRAITFYETVFNIKIQYLDLGGPKMGMFPEVEGAEGSPGGLMQYESYVPSHEGTLVYLSCDDLQNELDRIKDAGGKILRPKTQISPEHGYMGVFEDSEGNRVALHSRK